MAGFRTHIATSSVIGVGYAGVGSVAGLPLTTCLVAGGLCGLSGMLPDLDSDSGVPVRETMSFAAAIVPVLMIDRFQHMGLNHEEIVLVCGTMYLLIRFGVAAIFKRFTVHRGMWHSIPAAVTAALFGYLACGCEDHIVQMFKGGAVFLGFMSHLILDELNSVTMRRGRLHFKRSFGTALKFWGRNSVANLSTYSKLFVLLVVAIGDAQFFHQYYEQYEHKIHTARELIEDAAQQYR